MNTDLNKKYANKLKPCPFCGSQASINLLGDMSYVECTKCYGTLTEYGDNFRTISEEDLIETIIQKWNTRVNV